MNTSISFNQPKPHPYPLKIAIRAQRLVQGSLFYNVIADTSIGQYFRVVPDAVEQMKGVLLGAGWSEDTYEISWSCFAEYINEFKNPIFPNAVYSIISHWDWYISNLGKFIDFSENHISPEKPRDKYLLKLSTKPFAEQINIIKNQTGIIFKIENDTLDQVEEIHLVRNLGLHNQWEVDNTYLKHTKTKSWGIGEKRMFDTPELTRSHYAFLDLIIATSSSISIRYAVVPNYD